MSLQIEHVHLTVADGDDQRAILNDVSLSIAAGEVVAFTGASGSGKSTLLAVAALLQRPDSGSVVIAGQDVTDLDSSQRKPCDEITSVWCTKPPVCCRRSHRSNNWNWLPTSAASLTTARAGGPANFWSRSDSNTDWMPAHPNSQVVNASVWASPVPS